jgi:hypothetical protein
LKFERVDFIGPSASVGGWGGAEAQTCPRGSAGRTPGGGQNHGGRDVALTRFFRGRDKIMLRLDKLSTPSQFYLRKNIRQENGHVIEEAEAFLHHVTHANTTTQHTTRHGPRPARGEVNNKCEEAGPQTGRTGLSLSRYCQWQGPGPGCLASPTAYGDGRLALPAIAPAAAAACFLCSHPSFQPSPAQPPVSGGRCRCTMHA